MEFLTVPSQGALNREGALALFVRSKEDAPLAPLDERESAAARLLLDMPSFGGKTGKIVSSPLPAGGFSALYLVGLGERKPDEPRESFADNLRSRSAELMRLCSSHGVRRITAMLPGEPTHEASCAVAEGASLGAYRFDKYKGVKDEDDLTSPEEFVLLDGVPEGLSRGKSLASMQIASRDLANEPGNRLGPNDLAEMAVRWGEEHGFQAVVWDEERILKEEMGGLYSVGAASERGPRLIHMTWRPKGEPRRKVAFVGKGITFDSGGLNIKTGEFMRTMKGDKTGACNVLAVLRGAALLELPIEVHGIVPAAENMPGGRALRPDDILKMRNGKTVEVDNTDAEGRLVLADALAYASELLPDVIIDMATLTGACAVALGQNMAGLFSNDDALAGELLAASVRRGERLWRMPVDDDRIAKSMKSPVADLVNAGSRYGGAIFAARFLQEFVGEGIPWAHLDIAGVDMQKDEYSVYSKGATAFGVRTCLEYLLSL
ncbi:MAG: leucyl aminopeptidase [Synergistota bacterium]|nr:leucyl aminopeptidase [Synergistota bacterium]